MKKNLVLIAAALLLSGSNVAAQGWKNALKKATTEAADKATDGKLTQHALIGTWHYSAPGVKFEGQDLASKVGGVAIESTASKYLEKAYAMAGIKAGACSFVFNDDASFTASMGTHELSGTYEFDAHTHVATLHFAKGKLNLGTIPGHAYISGDQLQLVFPVTKLVEMVSAMGSHVSSLSAVTTLLEKYKNVYLGFAFKK